MNQEVKDILNQRRKLFVLEYAKAIGNARKVCKELNVPKSSFYDWKKAYTREGKAGLLGINQLPNHIPENLSNMLSIRLSI